MEAKEIQKYKKKSIPKLIKLATKNFNSYIRERDKKYGCISCPDGRVENAGHFFPTTFSIHRFDENNVNGQCVRCNKWQHGNLINYRIGLVKKIGEEKVKWLEDNRHASIKWDRYTLIDLILKYK